MKDVFLVLIFSLFSGFDIFFFQFQIYIVLIIVTFLFSIQSRLLSASSVFLGVFMKFFMSLYNPLMKFKLTDGFVLWLFSLMWGILLLNIMGILPYFFSFSSQVSVVFLLSILTVLSFFIFSLITNLFNFLLHLIPEGASILLAPFLFLIELISMVIRPLTVAIRLVANILAGHLLMNLLFQFSVLYSSSFVLYIFLNLVELGYCFIQSYIFCNMMALYYCDSI